MQMANQCLLRVIFSDNIGRGFLVHTMIPAVIAWKFCIVKEHLIKLKFGLFFQFEIVCTILYL